MAGSISVQREICIMLAVPAGLCERSVAATTTNHACMHQEGFWQGYSLPAVLLSGSLTGARAAVMQPNQMSTRCQAS